MSLFKSPKKIKLWDNTCTTNTFSSLPIVLMIRFGGHEAKVCVHKSDNVHCEGDRVISHDGPEHNVDVEA